MAENAEHAGNALEAQPDGIGDVVDVEARLLTTTSRGPDAWPSPFRTYRLSWLACNQAFGRFLIRTLVCFVLMAALKSLALFLVLFSFSSAWLAVCVAELRVVRLFTNEQGVWVRHGLWPWRRGVSGVKWRDISEASFAQNFSSWMTKSYAVRIGHRFTNSQEIRLNNVLNGHQAAAHINQLLMLIVGHLK